MRQPANKNEGVPAVVLHGLVRRKASVEEAYETALENWLHAWATGTNEEKRKAITALEKAQNEYENFSPAQSGNIHRKLWVRRKTVRW